MSHATMGTRQRVLNAITSATSDGITADTLAKNLWMRPSEIQKRLATLTKAGKVYLGTDGRYRLRGVSDPVSRVPVNTQTTHFVFIRDHSGSMQAHQAGADQFFQSQMRALTDAKDHQSRVTVFDFADSVKEITYNCSATYPAPWGRSGGNTALNDAIFAAVNRARGDTTPNQCFAVMVITDGEENASRKTSPEVKALIDELQATDHWTFAFMVPPGFKTQTIRRYGIPDGNVREWSRMDQALQVETYIATSDYVAQRTAGVMRSKSYFQPDLSKVGSYDLSKLTEVTDAKTHEVDKEMDILTFVNYKTGGRFAPGRSFFELMKKEDKIQDYKKFLIQDRVTKKIYADGPVITVRKVLGLPDPVTGGSTAIEPGNHAGFVIYVQSMSTNRILPRGTKLLFWERGA